MASGWRCCPGHSRGWGHQQILVAAEILDHATFRGVAVFRGGMELAPVATSEPLSTGGTLVRVVPDIGITVEGAA